jgi:peptidoglycan biosynthesis protein MviN/MurJ (putative lipid II flippase)
MQPAGRVTSFGSLAAKSVAVCIFGGAVFGAIAWVLIISIGTSSTDGILVLPFLPFYALPITIPLGAIAGVLGAVLIWMIRRNAWRPSSRRLWIALGGAVGFLLGASAPACLRLVGFAFHEMDQILIWAGTGAGAGGACGALLAWLTAGDLRVKHGDA